MKEKLRGNARNNSLLELEDTLSMLMLLSSKRLNEHRAQIETRRFYSSIRQETDEMASYNHIFFRIFFCSIIVGE